MTHTIRFKLSRKKKEVYLRLFFNEELTACIFFVMAEGVRLFGAMSWITSPEREMVSVVDLVGVWDI